MASDPKASPTGGQPAPVREKGVRIFTYPKIIFIFPTLIMAVICWVGMYLIRPTSRHSTVLKVERRRLPGSNRLPPPASTAQKTAGPTEAP